MELFLGVIVSIIAQIAKKILGPGEWKSLALVAGLSLGAAAVYQLFTYLGYWELVQQILITAGAFYAFVISRFPDASNSSVSES